MKNTTPLSCPRLSVGHPVFLLGLWIPAQEHRGNDSVGKHRGNDSVGGHRGNDNVGEHRGNDNVDDL